MSRRGLGGPQRDEHRKEGALRPLQGNGAMQLLRHCADQLKTEGVGRVEVQLLREPAAGVPDPEQEGLFIRSAELNADTPRYPLGKGVLETIGQQLVQQEAAGSGGVQADPDVLDAVSSVRRAGSTA